MAITKIGKELLKQAARWSEVIANIDPETRKRMEDGGAFKSREEYRDRFRRNTDDILARAGFEREEVKDPNAPKRPWYDASTDSETRTVHANIDRDQLPFLEKDIDKDMFIELITMHEAYEALESAKALERANQNLQEYAEKAVKRHQLMYPKGAKGIAAKHGGDKNKILADYANHPEAIYGAKRSGILISNNSPSDQQDNWVGTHQDINVLIKERNMLDRYPYQGDDSIQKFRSMRKQNGETQFLDKAGKYGDPKVNPEPLKHYGKKNIKEMFKTWGTPVRGIKDADRQLSILGLEDYVPVTEIRPMY